jgi:hypothetical protein
MHHAKTCDAGGQLSQLVEMPPRRKGISNGKYL